MKSTLNSPFFDTNQLLACRLVCAVGCKGIALRALCKLLATKCIANVSRVYDVVAYPKLYFETN